METWDLEALADEITTLAAQINAATCRWLRLVGEFDQLDGWAASGCRSCAHWVSWQCGVGLTAAREHVRVAARLRDLPLVTAAFERGELSYSKVRALVRVEEVEQEEDLLGLASEMTAAQLERSVRAYRGVVAVETGHAVAHERRSLSTIHDDDGSLVVRCRLPADEGALLLTALEAALDDLRRDRLGAEIEDDPNVAEHPPPNRVDALLLLCDKALSGGSVRTGGDRLQAIVEVDLATLRGDENATVGVTAEGAPVPAETMRRLCCDASIVPAHGGRIGARKRTIPASMRRALRRRDGGCRFPGCGARRYVDAHHIDHWAQGGETTLANLAQLCRHHHLLVHEGGFGIERDGAGTLVFRRPDGRPLPRIPRSRGACPDGVRQRLPHAGPRTLTGGTGEVLDRSSAVDALLAFAPPPTRRPR